MVKRGSLIAFEGIDGSGKSTQLARLAESLEAAGHCVVRTHEPTDGPIGQKIRAMARSGERVSAEQELAWFVDDRREHVATVITPALDEGEIVLTDRYTLSSVAYQGARGLDANAILDESEAAFPLPDLAILLRIDAADALERVNARGGVAEPAFERLDFLEQVAQIFDRLACAYLSSVDGTQDPDRVADSVAALVRARLGLL
jgi:dTMP kinase